MGFEKRTHLADVHSDLLIFTSFLSGFGERLLTEVKKLAPKDVKIKVGPGSFQQDCEA